MKKLIFSAVFFNLISSICFSQLTKDQANQANSDLSKNVAATTLEEYLYASGGYEDDVRMGKDTKAGYKFVGCGYWNPHIGKINNAFGYLVGMVRDGEMQPCAFILMFKDPSISYSKTLCIPTNDASTDIWSRSIQYFDQAIFTSLDTDRRVIYDQVLIRAMARIADLPDWDCKN